MLTMFEAAGVIMERTPMERPGWWFETDCHMEFQPENPNASEWQNRRMRAFVSRQQGRWVAHRVDGPTITRLGARDERDAAMDLCERKLQQQVFWID